MEEPFPVASLRRKNKAPRPPADTRSIESSSTLEFEAAIMEQKENLDRDIQLTVVLPDDVTTSASVNGSKPMMDLLIYLCAQYRLNPSTYTMELVSEGPSPVKFKPNTPVGMLEVDKVILKPRNVDEKPKKPAPVVPEQTVRVVINYKKTQKAVVRASPHVSLQELLPTISSKCELDPSHTVLLKDLNSQEPLEMSKSLNDLGLRELYAADTSRAASAAELHLSSSQESFQIPQSVDLQRTKEDEKGFFRFLRRSKKKREPASSAPATPLLADQRPAKVTRPSKVFKQYESNTLPTEMPKKRRAPLPPMYASQTVPKDFAQGAPRPQSCVVKSVSVDGGQQDISGKEVVRTGSLQLSGSSSNESTLRRGKRKAPPPPSPTSPPTPDRTDENGNETAKSSPTRSTSEDEQSDPPPVAAGAIFDYSLEGIEEKEENSSCHKEASEAAKVTAEPATPVDVAASTEKHIVVSPSPGVALGGSKPAQEEVPESRAAEARATNSTAVGTNTEELLLEKNQALKTLDLNSHLGKLESPNSLNEHAEHKSQAGTIELSSVRVAEEVRSTDGNIRENGGCKSNPPPMTNGRNHLNSPCKTVVELVMVKKHDAAIQTTSLHNDHLSEMDAGEFRFGDVEEINNPHWTVPNRLPLQPPSRLQQNGNSAINSTSRSYETTIMKENRGTSTSDGFVETENANSASVHSPSKGYALYRQLSEPKPKPSNEITRDYIPKVGMTTYKIVPPSSLEKLRFLEPEKWTDVKDTGYESQTQRGELYRSQSGTNSSSVDTKKDHHNYYSYSTDAHAYSTSASQTPINTIASNGPPLVMPKPDKARIPAEKRETQSDAFPKARTNSFYSQLQKRVTGQYVTSAAAKSVVSPVSPTNHQTIPTCIAIPNIPTIPPAHIRPTNLSSPTAFPSHPIPYSSAALTSPNGLPGPPIPTSPTARTSPTNLTGPVNHAAFPSPTIPPSPVALTSPTVPIRPTTLTSHTVPASPSPSPLTRPTADTHPPSPAALDSPAKHTSPAIPIPVESENVLPSNNTVQASSELIQSKDISNPEDGKYEKLSKKPPLIAPKPFSIRSKTSGLLQLRSFAAPRPYSTANAPSPFARAVTSAVRRSQSFSKASGVSRHPLRGGSLNEWSPPTSPDDFQPTSSENYLRRASDCTLEKKMNFTNSEKSSTVQCPPLVLDKKPPLSCPISDPEQIRQSLLDAIRSGEAAANLKRVTVRSNTISINGRSGWGHSVSTDVP